jgi:dolichol kinase
MVVLVPVKQVLRRFGSAIVVSGVFNIVAMFFLVIYVGEPAYVPWGIVPVAVFDALVTLLNRRLKRTHSLLVSSTVPGLLFYAMYFPFTLYLFPWSIQPQAFVVMTFGSVMGALAGLRIFGGMSALVLGGVQSQVKD